MLRAFLLVGLGGAVGSMARYAVSILTARVVDHPLPIATFLVNITGCFIIGLLFGYSERQQWMQGDGWLVLATGFCGGFTTYSAFALENVNLLGKGQSYSGIFYTAASVVLGVVLCRLGIGIMR